jgi:ATP synthase protein I
MAGALKPASTIISFNMGSVLSGRAWSVICFIGFTSVAVVYLFSVNKGISFALGAGINLIPMLLFGRIFFKTQDARAAKKIVSAFYIGETIKILTTILLFTVVFQWHGLKPLPLFLGFITAQLGCLMAFFSTTKI